MSLFSKMFKKNALDQKMEDAYEYIVENNPVMKKTNAAMVEGKEEITHALEGELYKRTGERLENRPPIEGDNDVLMREWDSMFDKIIDQELESIKICPSCGEAASAELECCPHCGAKLPEITAKEQVKDLQQAVK